ncbi:unnamed protein product [Gordionus sp. m RMFG-2023]
MPIKVYLVSFLAQVLIYAHILFLPYSFISSPPHLSLIPTIAYVSTRIITFHDFSKRIHVAGTVKQKYSAEAIYTEWLKFKLDTVNIQTYQVMLTYPNEKKQGFMIDKGGDVIWEFTGINKDSFPDKNDSELIPPYNADSADGNIESGLVYVNYGIYDDFLYLKTRLNISLAGKIGIARYGSIFRGSKVKNAEVFELAGLILYSDPINYALEGIDSNVVYPNTWWLPKSASMYRDVPPKNSLPSIPVYPISYSDAWHLFSGMDGIIVPQEWPGGLNFTYKTGPGFIDSKSEWKVKLDINLKREKRPIYNNLTDISKTLSGNPDIGELGSGSDFFPFMYYAGVTSMDIRYVYNKHIYPEFIYHKAASQLIAILVHYLSDSQIVPLSPASYGYSLTKFYRNIIKDFSTLEFNRICMNDLMAAITYFDSKMTIFQMNSLLPSFTNTTSSNTQNYSVIQTRSLNDKLLIIERDFTPSTSNDQNISHIVNGKSKCKLSSFLVEAIKKHIAVLAFTIKSIADFVDD